MKEKTSVSIGRRIKKLRKFHGISAKELSELLKISQQHLSRYENGKATIHIDTIYNICIIFDVDESYFFHNNLLENKFSSNLIDENISLKNIQFIKDYL